MSRHLVRRISLALVLLATGSAAQGQNSPTHDIQKLAAREGARAALRQQRTLVTDGRADNIDIKRQRLDLRVTPGTRGISGGITTRFNWVGTDRSNLFFDLTTGMIIDSVLYHAQHLTAVRADAYTIKIALPAPGQGYDSIAVYYHGNPPQTGFGSYVASGHGSTPIIWTLSEPYGARDWWPCKQDLRDKIDSVDMNMNVPVGNKVGSNGLLIGVTPAETGRQVYHWQERYPITCYLVSFAVTNYQEYTYKFKLHGDSLLYQNYIYPESNTATAHAQLDGLIPVIQAYDSLFGRYPFHKEKYGHAQFGWGGGEEHQTMSSMNAFDISLSAHELAHQWFGDKVTCGSWRDVWLNEGFATYCEGLSRMYLGNRVSYDAWKLATLRDVISQPGGSVWVDDTTTVNRIFDGRLSYNKGAFVLHALRGFIGDSAWYAGVQDYQADTLLAYGYARTADLKRHFELSSGKDLTEFFNDYFFGQGFPTYQINCTPHGTDSMSVAFMQTQSHVSVPFFENRVPLRVNYADGTADTAYFYNTANGQVFSQPIRGTVVSIDYDPEIWVLGAAVVTLSPATAVKSSVKPRLTAVPNPARQSVRIEGLPKPGQEAQVQVVDEAGRTLRQGITKSARFNLEGLPKGTYLLRIRQGAFAETLRVSLEQ